MSDNTPKAEESSKAIEAPKAEVKAEVKEAPKEKPKKEQLKEEATPKPEEKAPKPTPKPEAPKPEEKAPKPEKKVKEEPEDSNDGIFITEDDTFTIDVTYYLDDNSPIVKEFDEDFDSKDKEVHSFEMTFKHPSQKDAEYIMATRPIDSVEDAKIVDFIELENVRIVTLMRGWSMSRPLTDLASIHPEIVKAIRFKVSEKIGSTGLF